MKDSIRWMPLLTEGQDFEWGDERPARMDTLLTDIKKIIASNRRGDEAIVTFGTLLPVAHCSSGACARYHMGNDTWALTHAIIKDHNARSFGGHEMVIIGYNDDAIVMDNEGKKHRGLLTIRNSWGSRAGDYGNFYMTYDFFKVFVVDVQKIQRK